MMGGGINPAVGNGMAPYPGQMMTPGMDLNMPPMDPNMATMPAMDPNMQMPPMDPNMTMPPMG